MIREIFKGIKFKYAFSISILIILSVFLVNFSLIDVALLNNFEKHNLLYRNGDLYLHFVSVGASDCAVINFPNGEIAVVDSGSQSQAKNVVTYINTRVLNTKKDKVIDYLFLSHADEDHIGGAWEILNNFEVKNVIRPRQYASFELVNNENVYHAESDLYDEVVKKINTSCENVMFVNDDMEFNVGDVRIKIFYFDALHEDSNDYSYFMRMSFKSTSVLFTGDSSVTGEEWLLNNHLSEIKSDILKVAHHGASTSSSIEFLEEVKPKYAVISVGKNSYGHPTSDTIENLTLTGVSHILRTDKEGNILFKIGDETRVFFDDFSFIHFVSSKKISMILIVFVLCSTIFDFLKSKNFKRNHNKN